MAALLGLASEAGSILDCYKRYLRDGIDHSVAKEFLQEELGDLLWYVAAVARAYALSLGDIANRNLRRIRKLHPHPSRASAGSPEATVAPRRMFPRVKVAAFSLYQEFASQTSQLRLNGPVGPVAPMLGLASAVGKILGARKEHPFGPPQQLPAKSEMELRLGDVLWYLAAVAKAADLDLGEVASSNLKRAADLYCRPAAGLPKLYRGLPVFDRIFPPTERFPRRLVVSFTETTMASGETVAQQRIVAAAPNAFPQGPIKIAQSRKLQGFSLNRPLGASTTDNSRRNDGYRYHDAIHLAFMAVLGWSPVIRDLLRLKRKSDPAVDRDEDGARAIYTEEGLAALLSTLAPRRMGFLGENSVDGRVIEVAKAAGRGLEIKVIPGWLWRRAISRGFLAMKKLQENGGGYLTANLEERDLTYSRADPRAFSE